MSLLVLKPDVFAPEEVETIVASLEMMHETSLDFGALEIVEFHPKHTTGTSQKVHGGGGGVTVAASQNSASGAGKTTLGAKGDYIGKSHDQKDLDFVSGRSSGTVGSNGLLLEDWIDSDGNVVLTDKQLKQAERAMDKMDITYEEFVDNFEKVAMNSINANADQAMRDSQWYQHENETFGTPLAEEYGVTIDQVMGIASATSTNKQWDGVKSSNKDVTKEILDILKRDQEITITPEQAESYAAFSEKSRTSGGGKYGPETIEAGTYNVSQLSSGVLARTMSSGYQIGGQYYTDGLYKAFSIARGELQPNEAVGSLKQRSFINNLAHPEIDYSSTNDFWMARAAFGTKTLNITTKGGTGAMTMKEWEDHTGSQANAFFGSKGTGSGSMFAITTKAAKESMARVKESNPSFANMKTHEFQALVWVQMQREYGDYT